MVVGTPEMEAAAGEEEVVVASLAQGLQSRPVRSNRRPPVAVYWTGLTGNRWKPVEF
jgi:hypothetical protein